MKRLLAAIALLAFALPAFAQAPPATLRQHLIPVAAGAGIDITGDNTGTSYNGLIGPYVKSVTKSGGTLTILQQDENLDEGTVTFAPADGVVTGLSFTGTTLTVTRSAGLSALTVSGLGGSGGGGGTADGVVSGGTVSGGTLTLTRTESLDDVPITGLLQQSDVDARIATYARATPTGTIADAQIPSGIARDTELPSVPSAVSQSAAEGGSETGTRLWSALRVRQAINARVKDYAEQGNTADKIPRGDLEAGQQLPASPSNNQIPKWDGSAWVAADDEEGSGGGGGSDDGVVSGVTFDGETLTITRTEGDALTRDIDEIVRPDADGELPDAVDHQGRVAVSGNHVFESIDHGGADKVVEFKRYGTRTVLSGEPAKTTQENNYQGAFNAPPDISVYDASDILWDRGSQIWLFKQNANDVTWRSFGGPVGFSHGSLYADEATAARHVTESGKVYVIGNGSGQHVFIVTTYTAATDEEWRWDPLGLTLGDVRNAVDTLGGAATEFSSSETYDQGEFTYTGTGTSTVVWVADRDIAANSTEPTLEHPQNWRIVAGAGAIRGLLSGINVNILRRGDIYWLEETQSSQRVFFVRNGGTFSSDADLTDSANVIELTASTLIETHNTSVTAHNDIRSDVSAVEDRLDALDPVEIEAYDSTATYSRGSANSIVTHANHVWVYVSTQRNTNHDPEQFPQYWWKLDTPIRVLNHDSATTAHWRSGDFFLTETGELRMATATISASPADIIADHTGADQEFLWLNEPGGGGGGSGLAVQEEGTEVASAATTINFTGAGATATASNGTVTVDIPGGSGGGSNSVELWTGDIAVGTSNTWVAAGTDAVPSTAAWILFNGGTLADDVDDGAPADWRWINAAAWRGLTSAGAGDTVADGTAMQFAEWPSTDVASTNFTRRDVKIGRTSTNTVLITSMDAGEDFAGAAIRYVTGLGGSGGGSAVAFQDEGNARTGTATVNFTGAGVTATLTGDVLAVDIPGGSGGALADGSVTTAKLADGAVTTVKLADDAVTGAKIADDTIHGGALIDGTIATIKIGDTQVTGAKLSDNAVSTGKVAADAITQAKIADDAVGTDQLADGAVNAARLASNAVTTAKVADAAITTAKLAANAAGEGKVPIDDTMQFDGSGDLGVNTERVVQTVSEWVQHFATGDSHDTSGHSGKYQEYTSPNTVRRIGSVQYDFDPLNDSAGGGTGKTYQVFILELTGRNVDAVLGSSAVYSGNSLEHRFHFTDGVLINPNVRIGIGLHRTDGGNNEGLSVRFGTESQNSPRESYDDASEDFNFLGRFNHDRPTPSLNDTVGGTTANQIYGNPEIFYQIIHTHESLVGDGTVSVSHISSGSSADGTVLTADGSGGVAFEALPDGGGGGASLSDDTPDSLQPDQTGSAGTGTTASRHDHSHAISSSTPVGLGTSNQEGSFTSFARTNHVHRAFDSVDPSSHGIGQSGAPGTSTIAARRDHVHAIPVGVPVAVGTANAEGTATTASRSDHVHEGDGAGSDLQVADEGSSLTTAATAINFAGAGVTATASAGAVTVTIPGGGGGSGAGNPNATRIVTGATYDAGAGGNETIEAPGWRSCDLLFPVFHDSSESAAANANSNRPEHGVDMLFATALDTDGSIYVGVSQNEGVRILRAADNDFLTFQWVGTSPAPGTSDTLDIWCLDAGGSPGAEGEDTSVAPGTSFDETSINVPTSTWGYVNFGDIGEHRLGEWHRFLVADLTGLTDGIDNGAVSDANSLTFLANEEAYFRLGKTSGGKVLVGASNSAIQPGTVRIRSN